MGVGRILGQREQQEEAWKRGVAQRGQCRVKTGWEMLAWPRQ